MDSESTTVSGVIEEAAARWFAQRESGSWNDAEEGAFTEWLEQHPAHRIAYLRLEAAWSLAARMKALGAGVPAGVIPERGSWRDTRFANPAALSTPKAREDPPRFRRVRFLAVAAGALVAVLGGLYLYSSGILAGDRYSTRVGGLTTVPLADGSRVTLNTDSRIRVALEAKERRVDLDKGEAFFDVAKDPRRPFIVQVGDKRVVAVGTQFSVERRGTDIRVAVAEGTVRIDRQGAERESSTAGPREASVVLLGAGGIARTMNNEIQVRPDAESEVSELLSWRSGYLNFRDTPLAEAVAEFNRYNTRKIVIADPSVGAIRIGGHFRTDNTEGFLWLLQSGFPIVVEERDERVLLRSRS